jgi:hypothetical protein
MADSKVRESRVMTQVIDFKRKIDFDKEALVLAFILHYIQVARSKGESEIVIALGKQEEKLYLSGSIEQALFNVGFTTMMLEPGFLTASWDNEETKKD